MRPSALLVGLVAACHGAKPPAPAPAPETAKAADETPPEKPAISDAAKAHYIEGRTRYDLGDYTRAIGEFKAAYLDSPDPVFLFNIGQAYRLSGDCATAGTYYQKFLDAGAAKPEQRAQVQDIYARCH